MVKYAKDNFMTHIKAPRRFFDLLADEYSKTMPDPELYPTGSRDRSVFERAITSFEDFLDRANCGLDGILQMCGVCDEWCAAEGICKFMREMIGMVEDILLCLAEGRDSELVAAFIEGELWYQEYKFPIAVLMRDQHNMLKTFLSAFKIARSGSVEEQDDFWENVYLHWFTTWPEHTVHFADIPDDQALSGLQEAAV
ncbi:hypothetical protein BDR07DRAFT_1376372 [Suillus spraguei]|nr:hypothetical protein BDR07DRAFT_1376372 [Suillus spraguei]